MVQLLLLQVPSYYLYIQTFLTLLELLVVLVDSYVVFVTSSNIKDVGGFSVNDKSFSSYRFIFCID